MNELLEQRVADLEKTVQQLQHQVNRPAPAADWIEQMTGAFKNEPAFPFLSLNRVRTVFF